MNHHRVPLFTMRMIGGLDYYVAVKQVRVGMMCMSAMMMMMYVGGDDDDDDDVRSNCIPSNYI